MKMNRIEERGEGFVVFVNDYEQTTPFATMREAKVALDRFIAEHRESDSLNEETEQTLEKINENLHNYRPARS